MRYSSRLGLVVGLLLLGGGGLPGCSGENMESRPTAELNKPVQASPKAERNSMDIMAKKIEKRGAKAEGK